MLLLATQCITTTECLHFYSTFNTNSLDAYNWSTFIKHISDKKEKAHYVSAHTNHTGCESNIFPNVFYIWQKLATRAQYEPSSPKWVSGAITNGIQ